MLIDNTLKPANLLRISSWNIHGSLLRKHELGEIAQRYNSDVIALQETFILLKNRIALGNYVVYRNDRIGGGGETAILVKKGLKHHQLLTPVDLQRIEAKGIEISNSRYGRMWVYSMYSKTYLGLKAWRF